MAFRYDPANISTGGSIIPEGEYEAYIASAIEKTSKSSGADMIEFVFHVATPDGGERKVWEYIVEKTVFKLRLIAEAAGCLDSFATGVFDAAAYTGKNLVLNIKHRPDRQSGETRATIASYSPSKFSTSQALAKVGQATPAARKPAGVVADPTVTEDDIPF